MIGEADESNCGTTRGVEEWEVVPEDKKEGFADEVLLHSTGRQAHRLWTNERAKRRA